MHKKTLRLTDPVINNFLRDFRSRYKSVDSVTEWLWEQYSARIDRTAYGHCLTFHDDKMATLFILKYA